MSMLECWKGGIGPDSVGTGHVPSGVKGVRECSLRGNYVPGHHCDGVSCLSQAGVGAAGSRGLEGRAMGSLIFQGFLEFNCLHGLPHATVLGGAMWWGLQGFLDGYSLSSLPQAS